MVLLFLPADMEQCVRCPDGKYATSSKPTAFKELCHFWVMKNHWG